MRRSRGRRWTSVDRSLFRSILIPFYSIAARCPPHLPCRLSPSSTMPSMKFPSLSSSLLAVVVAIAFRVCSGCEMGSNLKSWVILTCQDCTPRRWLRLRSCRGYRTGRGGYQGRLAVMTGGAGFSQWCSEAAVILGWRIVLPWNIKINVLVNRERKHSVQAIAVKMGNADGRDSGRKREKLRHSHSIGCTVRGGYPPLHFVFLAYFSRKTLCRYWHLVLAQRPRTRNRWLSLGILSQVLVNSYIDTAAKGIVSGTLVDSGQVCISTSRIFVQWGVTNALTTGYVNLWKPEIHIRPDS